MTERDALLAAIRANPEEDTPRLVFADWLDENEPDAKPRGKKVKAAAPSSWAALIRTECELARLEDDGSASAAIYKFFKSKDEQSLRGVRWDRTDPGVARLIQLRALADRLRGPSAKARNVGRPHLTLNRLGAVWTPDTHRGFPDGLGVRWYTKFHQEARPLIAFAPSVRIALDMHALPPMPADGEWIAREVLAWCHEVEVEPHMAGAEHLVAAMSALREATGVRALRCRRGAEGLVARILAPVAESPHWSGLRELEFDASFALPAKLIGRLFGAPHLHGLRRLKVTGDGYANGVGTALGALGGLTELRELALSNCALDDGDAVRLANTAALANLRHLDLSNNRIGGPGASALLASPHLANLAVLDLDDNVVRGIDRAALAGAPVGGLRTLGFHGSRLTANDITALTSSPRLSELMYFDADYNELAESAVARLVKGFGERPPAVLYLIGNDIADAGVEALTNWPAAERIDMLHLSDNTLPTTAAKALACCPHLKGLNHLCAGVAHPAGRKVLKKCFGSRAFV